MEKGGAVASGDTKQELLWHLDKVTREMSVSSLREFTTASIASAVSVSRNLASQYLNELVRDGLAVKVDSRPVLFLHRRNLGRFLQVRLDSSEYSSLETLLDLGGMKQVGDFDLAIGNDLSLSSPISHLRSAVSYPPSGLPILLHGERGTGKATLAWHMFQYGQNQGLIRPEAQFVRVRCVRYAGNEAAFHDALMGTDAGSGLIERSRGGIVLFDDVDALTAPERDLVTVLLRGSISAPGMDLSEHPARLAFATTVSATDAQMAWLAQSVPITVGVPALRDRTLEERTEFALHLLRAEGRRVACDVSISRGALRALVSADFSDNIDGLKACVTNCCASAYPTRQSDRLIVRSYNLPSSVLGADMREKDDEIVSCDRDSHRQQISRSQEFFQGVVDSWYAQVEGKLNFDAFLSAAQAYVRAYEDYLSFDNYIRGAHVHSYEQVIASIASSMSAAHGVDLSRKDVRVIAQTLYLQLWDSGPLARWRQKNASAFDEILSSLSAHLSTAATISDSFEAEIRVAFGTGLDALSRTVVLLGIVREMEAGGVRDAIGIVMCHGYSTATSIADAANRLLDERIFEAVDMTYDQSVTDVLPQLARLVDRYSYCATIVLLYDMGSLSETHTAVSRLTDAHLYVVNNVSSGLALEVGAALAAHENIESTLATCATSCAPSFSVVHASRRSDAIIFCSESGVDAADKIRMLFEQSLPADCGVVLVTAGFADLVKGGKEASVFERYVVRAIVGTLNPSIKGVPFFSLEDVLFGSSSRTFDDFFSKSLAPSALKEFHGSLQKNLTLSNVVESITILNPERLLADVECAMRRLQEIDGHAIDSRLSIGLLVHLCVLVERLVTNTPIEALRETNDFALRHTNFIEEFLRSFRGISHRYHVEVPVSEIAYVWDYLNGEFAFSLEDGSAGAGGDACEDE